MSMRRALPILVAVALIALVATDAFACPNCKDAVADNSPGGAQGATAGGDAASAFNGAIYFALASVFSIAGGLTWKIYRAVNRNPA